MHGIHQQVILRWSKVYDNRLKPFSIFLRLSTRQNDMPPTPGCLLCCTSANLIDQGLHVISSHSLQIWSFMLPKEPRSQKTATWTWRSWGLWCFNPKTQQSVLEAKSFSKSIGFVTTDSYNFDGQSPALTGPRYSHPGDADHPDTPAPAAEEAEPTPDDEAISRAIAEEEGKLKLIFSFSQHLGKWLGDTGCIALFSSKLFLASIWGANTSDISLYLSVAEYFRFFFVGGTLQSVLIEFPVFEGSCSLVARHCRDSVHPASKCFWYCGFRCCWPWRNWSAFQFHSKIGFSPFRWMFP